MFATTHKTKIFECIFLGIMVDKDAGMIYLDIGSRPFGIIGKNIEYR
jgi:hypothetical protein